jgi:hypothetical protein
VAGVQVVQRTEENHKEITFLNSLVEKLRAEHAAATQVLLLTKTSICTDVAASCRLLLLLLIARSSTPRA